MTGNEINIAGLNAALAEMSALERWATVAGALLVAVLVALVTVVQLRIRHRRGEMLSYGRFLENTYGTDSVPMLLYRYWEREVERYNRSRRRWPWRLLWREARTDRFVLKVAAPPKPVSGPQAPKPVAVPIAATADAKRPETRPCDPPPVAALCDAASAPRAPQRAGTEPAGTKEPAAALTPEETKNEEMRASAAPARAEPSADNTTD